MELRHSDPQKKTHGLDTLKKTKLYLASAWFARPEAAADGDGSSLAAVGWAPEAALCTFL